MTTIPWLGKVRYPDVAAKRAFDITLGKMLQTSPSGESDIELPYFNSASVQWAGVRPDPEVRMWVTAREVRELTVRRDDLLICEGGDVGRAAIYDGPEGFIFQNSVHRARSIEGSDIRFFGYVLRALHGSGWLDVLCNKATIRHLTGDKLGALRIPMPSLGEQRRISDFLDVETARIDRLMRLRREQSRLVREQSETVVRQFFAEAEGRREYRFRHLMQVNPCYGVLVPKFTDRGVPLIRVGDLGCLDRDIDRLPQVDEIQAEEYRRTRISPGDLLITVVGATIGRCDVAPKAVDGFNVSRAIARVQLIPGVSPEMIATWVRGRDFRIQAELATSGAAAQPALNMSDLVHFTIWLPDTEAGRRDLARCVSAHEDRMSRLLSKLDQQLAVIAERHQALITAAVTGQFDVSTASGRNVTEGITA